MTVDELEKTSLSSVVNKLIARSGQTAPLQIPKTRSNGNVVLTWPTNIVCHLQAQTNSLVGGNWSDIANATNPIVVMPD